MANDNKSIKHSMLKRKNMRIILEMFRKNACSTYQIGREVGLSSGGAKKLVDEIVDCGLIVKSQAVRRYSSGRMPICYQINPDYQWILVVDYILSTAFLMDLCGRTLKTVKLLDRDYEFTNEYIYESIEVVKKEFFESQDAPIGVIAIVYSGKFSKEGKPYFSGAFQKVTINIFGAFNKAFGIDVVAYNDLHYALLSERKNGLLTGDEKSVCLLNIGRGVSCSMLIDDRLYVGATGIAGEIGQNYLIGSEDVDKTNEDYMSWWRIRRQLEKMIAKGVDVGLQPGFKSADAVVAYKDGNPYVKQLVELSAKNIARLLKNMIDFMDFTTVIIMGKMLEFGKEYCDALLCEFNRITNIANAFDCYSRTDIRFAESNEADMILDGAFECARDKIFHKFVKERSLKVKAI